MGEFEKIKEKVSILLNQGKVPHSIMLEGSEKETHEIALLFVQGLVCTSESNKPCRVCLGCKKVELLHHPDVIIPETIEVSGSLSVSTARRVRDDSHIMPNEAENKVYIFEKADKMTVQAQNAMLKVVESPPDHVYFIFIVEEVLSVLPTLRSRSTIFRLNNCICTTNNQAQDVASQIMFAVTSVNELEVEPLSLCLINDKSFFKEVVVHLLELLDTICRDIVGKTMSAYNASGFLNVDKVVNLIGVLEMAKLYITSNVNHTLLVTWTLAEMRRKVFLD